jgi:hypothetical protein
MDGVQNGKETDTDCGGGTCAPCVTGDKCVVDTDCVSAACDAVTNRCVADQCADQHKDGNETAVDCGGGTCPACANGLACVVDTDCMSNACDGISLVCVSDQCADHRTDGNETAVDCGGGTCPACANGLACAADTDCASNACDGISLVCVSDQCADHRTDGNETDVDCGGTDACNRCLVGQKCVVSTDCQATHTCAPVTNVCQ